MRLRLYGSDFYSGDSGVWYRGVEKDVSEQEGDRLLATFPQWFERVGGQPQGASEAESLNQPIEKAPPAPARNKLFGKARGK